jgi:hypothetical protein
MYHEVLDRFYRFQRIDLHLRMLLRKEMQVAPSIGANNVKMFFDSVINYSKCMQNINSSFLTELFELRSVELLLCHLVNVFVVEFDIRYLV